MDWELSQILNRGVEITYDFQGNLRRWEWRDSLEDCLRDYFYKKFALEELQDNDKE
jgi:hypothetical protein